MWRMRRQIQIRDGPVLLVISFTADCLSVFLVSAPEVNEVKHHVVAYSCRSIGQWPRPRDFSQPCLPWRGQNKA
jgi:hypothetical protein